MAWEGSSPASKVCVAEREEPTRVPCYVIDLHCHILAGIDDGAIDLSVSLQMARALVADGVAIAACTPHILPGLYHNTGPGIRAAVKELQSRLKQEGIPLFLVPGADNHIVPDFVAGLRSGHLLTIADTRYVLIEPPHHVAPQRMEELFFAVQAAGYTPILTHPERLSWVRQHYDAIDRLIKAGVLVQITAGSLTGAFGRSPLYWATRMLEEGGVHIIATDAHDMRNRPPRLSEGYGAALKRVGEKEAANLVWHRPRAILENALPSALPALSNESTTISAAAGAMNVDAPEIARLGRVGQNAIGIRSRHASRSLAERMRSFFD